MSFADSKYIKISSHLFPSESGLSIGGVPIELKSEFGDTQPRWYEINAEYVGSVDDVIDVGYFNKLNVINFYMSGELQIGNMVVSNSGMTGNISYVGESPNNPINVGYFKDLWVNNLTAGSFETV